MITENDTNRMAGKERGRLKREGKRREKTHALIYIEEYFVVQTCKLILMIMF